MRKFSGYLRHALLLASVMVAATAGAQGSNSAGVTAASPTPNAYDLKENYTKYEYQIPMRDGKRLFTSVYLPKFKQEPAPFLMTRTPYSCGPYGADRYPRRLGPNEDFLKAGYIFVCQDVRGRFMSEGKFIEMTPHKRAKKSTNDIDESTDMHDTVQWLLERIPGHNGKVGIWGISYPGFFTSASIIDSHPAIKAASPQAPIADFYMGDDWFHGGAFMLVHNYAFATFFKPHPSPTVGPKYPTPFDFKTSDGYEYFLGLGNLSNIAKSLGSEGNPDFGYVIGHPTYDSFWQERNILPHLKNIKAAVLTVGGWFDAEDLPGTLQTYKAIESNNPNIANSLVMGPWVHGGWLRGPGKAIGHVDFATKTSEFFQKKILLPFFEQHLRGGSDAKLPEASVFETGTNIWRQFSAWPPANTMTKQLYLHAGGQLRWQTNAERDGIGRSPARESFDQYLSDPNKPVPYVGYTALSMPAEHMVADQRFAATRTDVLVYQTDVLEEDLTIAGPIKQTLFVSTSGTDSDWIVKLIDVYPSELGDESTRGVSGGAPQDVAPPKATLAGYQQLIRGEPLRARYRNGFEKAEPTEPGKIEKIEFVMPDILHTFRRGHRVMVQIQSSMFPKFDRNPQTFVDIKDALPEHFRIATQRVYRSATHPSSIELLILQSP